MSTTETIMIDEEPIRLRFFTSADMDDTETLLAGLDEILAEMEAKPE